MPRSNDFADLIAYQRARALTRDIFTLARDGAFERNYGFIDQIQRAAASVMANIAEGYDRSGSVEFARFLSIAKGSCAEVRAFLDIALDAAYIDAPTYQSLTEKAREVSRIIVGLRRSVERREK